MAEGKKRGVGKPRITKESLCSPKTVSLPDSKWDELDRAAEWAKIGRSQLILELAELLPTWTYNRQLAASRKAEETLP
jgi:hypothetical protein